MLEWDPINKQLLSVKCRQCPDPYFAPFHDEYPHVGCCSYSPVFGLFEIYKMVQAGDRAYFLERIYHNKSSIVEDLTITVHAYIEPLYHEMKSQNFSHQQEADLRLSFSRCVFFVQREGCGLPPAYKNSTCRSFICSTIEEGLEDKQRMEFTNRVREIQNEVLLFEEEHKPRIKQNGWSFTHDMEDILDYLETLT